MAILEAQAAGLPVVAGRSGGVAAVVRDGETGLLTAPGDATAFAQGLRALLSAPEKRHAMGRAAAANVARLSKVVPPESTFIRERTIGSFLQALT